MITCPACSSLRVVIVLAEERRAFCGVCGTLWIQDGGAQRRVVRRVRRTRVPPRAS